MGKNNYYLGLIILIVDAICLWGLIVSVGWFAWLSVISTMLSMYGLKYNPRWFYIICLFSSSILLLYLVYGIIVSL